MPGGSGEGHQLLYSRAIRGGLSLVLTNRLSRAGFAALGRTRIAALTGAHQDAPLCPIERGDKRQWPHLLARTGMVSFLLQAGQRRLVHTRPRGSVTAVALAGIPGIPFTCGSSVYFPHEASAMSGDLGSHVVGGGHRLGYPADQSVVL